MVDDTQGSAPNSVIPSSHDHFVRGSLSSNHSLCNHKSTKIIVDAHATTKFTIQNLNQVFFFLRSKLVTMVTISNPKQLQ